MLGPNSGSNSSFARSSDGSCAWNKDAGNSTPGLSNTNSSSITQIELSTSTSSSCVQTVNIAIDASFNSFTSYNWELSSLSSNTAIQSGQDLDYPPTSFSILDLSPDSYRLF